MDTLVNTLPLLCMLVPVLPDLEDEFADLGPEAGGGDRRDREQRRNRYEEDDFGGEGR